MSKERIEDGGPRGTMDTLNHTVGVRPARRVRLIGTSGRRCHPAAPYAGAAGWLGDPLSREQQDADFGW
jgi:hypothetical protein